MNGYSLLFAVVVILAIAIISGTVVAGLLGSRQLAARPIWHRRKTKGPTPLHH